MHNHSTQGRGRRALLAGTVVLFAAACHDGTATRDVTSPGFSLASAQGVQSGVDRQARFLEPDGQATSLAVPDTSQVYAAFEGDFAFADSAAGVAGPVSVRDHEDFSGGDGGYWVRTDRYGVTRSLRLTTAGGPWSKVELFEEGRLIGTFEWSWTRVTGGWQLKTGRAIMPLEDGSSVEYTSTSVGEMAVVAADHNGRASGQILAAGFNLFGTVGAILPGPLPPHVQAGCGPELVEAAAAAAFAAMMWWRAKNFPTPGRVRQAWAATAYAGKKAADAAKCLRRQAPALDRG